MTRPAGPLRKIQNWPRLPTSKSTNGCTIGRSMPARCRRRLSVSVGTFARRGGLSMSSLAELAVKRQGLAQARQLLEQALPHRQATLRIDPQNVSYRQSFREERSDLAPVLAGLGDHGGATATAEELAGLGWDPA